MIRSMLGEGGTSPAAMIQMAEGQVGGKRSQRLEERLQQPFGDDSKHWRGHSR